MTAQYGMSGLGIGLHDLDFDEVPVVFRSSCGSPYTRWLRVGMPRIPEEVIQSVFFLYRNRQDAEAGVNPGGTGFILGTGLSRLRMGDGPAFYGVTNWHVACMDGYSVIRLPTADGSIDVRDFGPEDWHFIPRGPDVAVVPLDIVQEYPNFIPHVHIAQFEPKSGWHITIPNKDMPGVGDDVFMLGLFVDHKGLTTDVPSARFGNISMLPNPSAPIEQPNKVARQSYVVDMHARTGFSGSPVFLFRTFGSDLTTDKHRIERLTLTFPNYPLRDNHEVDAIDTVAELRTLFYFLGILWGQFPEPWELTDGALKSRKASHLIKGKAYVEGFSGMSCVAPSWDIEEVLNLPKLQKMREDMLRATPKRVVPKPMSAADEHASEANPDHREDFTHLLNAAARKRERED